jgi:hypothetical protein
MSIYPKIRITRYVVSIENISDSIRKVIPQSDEVKD